MVQRCSFIQIPFAMLTALFARLVSSLKANRVLLWGAFITLAVNAGANYLLMQRWGVVGIALARAVVALASFVYLTKMLHNLLRKSTHPAVSAVV
jgi:Na+-driven multidrug efflux pump